CGAHLFEALVGQRPVLGVGGDVEVHVTGAVLGHVSVPAVDEPPHQFDHFRDVPGGARLHRGRQAAQGVVGLSESAVVAFADLPPLHAFGRGDVENLVVDVGDVAAEDDPVAAVHQPAAEDVEADARADVPDVRGSLHGGTTQVQRDTSLTQRDEVTDLTGSGVVEAQTHGVKVSRFPTVSAIALVFPCGIRGNADCRTVP